MTEIHLSLFLFYQTFLSKTYENGVVMRESVCEGPQIHVLHAKCVRVESLTDFFNSSTTFSDKRKQNDSGEGGKST